MASTPRARRLRWSAPFAVAAIIALIVAVPGLSAASTPTLPALTPAQLIAKVQAANVTHLSGTIDMSTNLGIPDLSELTGLVGGGSGGESSDISELTGLLSGSHQALVWFAGATQNRVDLLQSMAETDVIHNGKDVWLWDSSSRTYSHSTVSDQHKDSERVDSPGEIKTPQQVADDLLAHISSSTTVSVTTPLNVAGRKAYELVLAPHAAQSTIDHVTIAVDSVTGLPLQVEVFAKGQKADAVKLGFGSISFATPKASEFDFTPPPGSTATNGASSPAHHRFHRMFGAKGAKGAKGAPMPAAVHVARPQTGTGAASKPQTSVTVGQDWTAVTIFSNVAIPPQLSQYLKAGTSVSGKFGQGTLFQTAVANILVLKDGRIAVGAVNASALEAAVASAP